MYDIIHKKLAFSLEEGVFFNEIDGFSLKVEKKIDDNVTKKTHRTKSVQTE